MRSGWFWWLVAVVVPDRLAEYNWIFESLNVNLSSSDKPTFDRFSLSPPPPHPPLKSESRSCSLVERDTLKKKCVGDDLLYNMQNLTWQTNLSSIVFLSGWSRSHTAARMTRDTLKNDVLLYNYEGDELHTQNLTWQTNEPFVEFVSPLPLKVGVTQPASLAWRGTLNIMCTMIYIIM